MAQISDKELILTEQASATTPAAGSGKFWVKNDAPNIPKFTDDAGNTVDVITSTSPQVAGKNVIIGGDFTTNPWQRGTSFAAIAFGDYCADRWIWSGFGSTGVVTISQVEDAPTTSSSRHCLQVDVTTADTSIATSDLLVLQHRIEGKNLAHLHAGTANAKTVTLSFWHKHTKTGTYCVGFRSGGAGYSYAAEYTQSVTDTWEKAEITLTLETTGGTSEWPLDNTEGLRLTFVMAAGSNYHITADTWSAGSDFSTSNQVNAADSTSNFMRIADVQLELGEVATTFDTRDAGTELALCQRYYRRWDGTDSVNEYIAQGGIYNTTTIYAQVQLDPAMRASPTSAISNAAHFQSVDTGTVRNLTNWTLSLGTKKSVLMGGAGSGLTQGNACSIRLDGTAGAYWELDAEL